MRLPFALLHDAARLPAAQREGDAGLDLASVDELVLAPGERALVGVGVAVEIPPGHCGLVVPRSGLAARHGITILNAPGLVDSGYRGEVRVALLNTDREAPFRIAVGDRIAQLVVVALPAVEPVVADALAASDRGAHGFGSTGRD
jgi:dUTP pyrophosphatase